MRGMHRKPREKSRVTPGLSLECPEVWQLMSASQDNVPRSYDPPIETFRTPQFVSLGWDDNTAPVGCGRSPC